MSAGKQIVDQRVGADGVDAALIPWGDGLAGGGVDDREGGFGDRGGQDGFQGGHPVADLPHLHRALRECLGAAFGDRVGVEAGHGAAGGAAQVRRGESLGLAQHLRFQALEQFGVELGGLLQDHPGLGQGDSPGAQRGQGARQAAPQLHRDMDPVITGPIGQAQLQGDLGVGQTLGEVQLLGLLPGLRVDPGGAFRAVPGKGVGDPFGHGQHLLAVQHRDLPLDQPDAGQHVRPVGDRAGPGGLARGWPRASPGPRRPRSFGSNWCST
ncbi:MAG TPA: hypothetical protein VHU88_19380 [Sporichthyaceae bacterium]|jgi:hypothetical protein|nr:hypothetical protein [Sporichthyaceae bacterium]